MTATVTGSAAASGRAARVNLTVPVLLLLGVLAFLALPWYGERIEGPALLLAWNDGRWWLAPALLLASGQIPFLRVVWRPVSWWRA